MVGNFISKVLAKNLHRGTSRETIKNPFFRIVRISLITNLARNACVISFRTVLLSFECLGPIGKSATVCPFICDIWCDTVLLVTLNLFTTSDKGHHTECVLFCTKLFPHYGCHDKAFTHFKS